MAKHPVPRVMSGPNPAHPSSAPGTPGPTHLFAGDSGPQILSTALVVLLALGCSDGLGARRDAGRPTDTGRPFVDAPGLDAPGTDAGMVTGMLVEEICTNGVDEDRNGSIDDGCPCAVGTRRACWPGPPADRAVGVCNDGEQTCDSDGATSAWSLCRGATIAGPEIRDDGADNDCDGMADEAGGICVPSEQREMVCDDGHDSDCDTAIDCDDPDCAMARACERRCTVEELVCWGETDDDCDGQPDCMDSDCAGDPSCIMPDCPDGQVLTYRPRMLSASSGPSSIRSGDGLPATTSMCEPGTCPTGQVRVVTSTGTICVPPPPECPAGTSPNYAGYARWECAPPCELIIHYGGIYGGRNVCADRPDITCGGGQTPTFVFETERWECRPTCDNGLYDRIVLDGILLCVPC